MNVPVIAIDGPSGSGKGTVARRLAARLGWHLLDSGALYRLTALAAGREGVRMDDVEGLARVAAGLDVAFDTDEAGDERVWLEGEDVTGELRSETCGERASRVAALPPVRAALGSLQRSFRRPPGLVADGRDMGTVVFPDAPLKIFLTASPEERAKRRHKQLKDKDIGVNLAALSRDIAARDKRDAERAVAPLVPAPDARTLDSTGMPVAAVMERVLGWVAEAFGAADLRE